MNVWDYFAQKEEEFKDLSLVPVEPMFAEVEGSDGRRGRVLGELVMTERSSLHVHEKVVVVGGTHEHVRREEYAYYLTVDGEEVWGFDRDPSHSPVEHGHRGPDHTRTPASRVTFKQVAEKAWDDATLLEHESP